jgi:hypothetical protein
MHMTNYLLAAEYVRMQEREYDTPEWQHRVAARSQRKPRPRAGARRLRWPVRRFGRAAVSSSEVC